MTHERSGFTLIELLIVVVIIGILAAIAIPRYTSVKEKGYISAVKADLRNLATQEDLYYNDHYAYTNTPVDMGFDNSEGVIIAIGEATNTGWSATAYHAGLPAETCAVYHGRAAQVSPATVVSAIMCSR